MTVAMQNMLYRIVTIVNNLINVTMLLLLIIQLIYIDINIIDIFIYMNNKYRNHM